MEVSDMTSEDICVFQYYNLIYQPPPLFLTPFTMLRQAVVFIQWYGTSTNGACKNVFLFFNL